MSPKLQIMTELVAALIAQGNIPQDVWPQASLILKYAPEDFLSDLAKDEARYWAKPDPTEMVVIPLPDEPLWVKVLP